MVITDKGDLFMTVTSMKRAQPRLQIPPPRKEVKMNVSGGRAFRSLFVVPMLAALFMASAARANGDHPLRLPPPDPGPALAKIAADAQAKAQLPPPPLATLPPFDAPRERGQAVFSPFSGSKMAAPSDEAAQADTSMRSEGMLTTFGLIALVAAGAGLWRWVRQA